MTTPVSKPTCVLLLARRVDCVDGITAYYETLCDGLKARGDRVLLVSGPVTQTDGSVTRRRAVRRAVEDWIEIDDLGTAWPRPAQVQRILEAMRRHGVEVLVPQGLSTLPLAWLLGRLSGRRVVAHYHPSAHADSPDRFTARPSFKARLAYKLVCKVFPASRFIAGSKEIEDFFRRDCSISRQRIHRQVFGIDTSTFRPPTPEERSRARARFGFDDDTLGCVLSGRMNLVKGHDLAVDAVRRLRHDRPGLDVRCLFAGGGDQRERIERDAFIDDADRRSFHFLGFLDSAESLREVYWAADILLLPSRFEGFGLVVPEAMCCGAVPIRTPTGGCADQIEDGSNGFVVPFNDAAELAARIADLSDPTRRAAMRQRAIETASNKFAKQVMVDGTSELLRSMAARVRPR